MATHHHAGKMPRSQGMMISQRKVQLAIVSGDAGGPQFAHCTRCGSTTIFAMRG
jgi:hypothetical protein